MQSAGQRARSRGGGGAMGRDVHRHVGAREPAAIAVGADGSAIALELAAYVRASGQRGASQPEGTLRPRPYGAREARDVPRQNVHAIGVRRGVRGV